MRTIVCLALFLCVAIATQPDYINITSVPYLIPESMDYVSGRGFILGSLVYGGAYKIDPAAPNTVSVFISGSDMNHTAGVQYDTKGGRNRILLCSGILPPPSGPGGAFGGVVSVDLSGTNPTQAAFYETTLVGNYSSFKFCNDMIADNAGTIYATDSLGSQIWKITTAGVVSTLIHDSRWDCVGFCLDGIEMTPDGNLIASHITNSQLWLINLSAAPVTATQITVSGGYAGSAPDGIYFSSFGCLHTVGNNKVYRLASTDGWMTATVLETVTVTCLGPTAIAWDADASSYYVSCAHGFDGGPYAIERITFAAQESASLCHTSAGALTGTSAGALTAVSLLMVLVTVSMAILFS